MNAEATCRSSGHRAEVRSGEAHCDERDVHVAVRGALGDDSTLGARDAPSPSATRPSNPPMVSSRPETSAMRSRVEGATAQLLKSRGESAVVGARATTAHRAGPQGLGRLRGVHREGGARAEADESGGANVDRVVEDEGSVRLGETRDGESARSANDWSRGYTRASITSRERCAPGMRPPRMGTGRHRRRGRHAHGAAHHHAARREKAKHGVVSGGQASSV